MKLFSLFAALILVITACGNGHEHHDDQQATERSTVAGSNAEFQQSFRNQLDYYFDLSAAMVSSDAEKTAEKAEAFADAINETEVSGLYDEQRQNWSETVLIITERANNMADLDDIEAQRYEFEYLSESIIEIVGKFGVDGVVYHQRCPMVRGGSADWLSKEEHIRNPYHGDRMLTCGTVVSVIE